MTDSQPSDPPSVRYGQPSADRSMVPGFGRPSALAGLLVVALAVGGLLWSATAGHTVSAQRPQLYGGYLVLEDDAHPLPVVNLATGDVTVRLQGVDSQVSATGYQDVQAVPVDEGTMLVNKTDGTFNLLGKDNYVLDTAGAGVGLGPLAGLKGAAAVADGSDAYIIRYAPQSTVSLVDQDTVQTGAKLEVGTAGHQGSTKAVVTPRGFSQLTGSVANQSGSVVVSQGDLWALVAAGSQCQVVQLQPVPTGHNGLLRTTRATLPAACGRMALGAENGNVGVAWPGHVRLFLAGSTGPGSDVTIGTTAATAFLPVTGASDDLWYLGQTSTGWSVLGVSPGGHVTGPSRLAGLRPDADPVAPVVSDGLLYTLDQTQPGQPTLWTIVPSSGAMIVVQGEPNYPAASASEKANFLGAQVLVDGPRVVFNNPGSLYAVVVFTDQSHAPVVVNKTVAVELSAAGPADISAGQSSGSSAKGHNGKSPASKSVPVVQAVSQSVTCANTTQKPYAPQITSITPSSGSALVTWSYQLLDLTDCEPDSWAVHVTAISGSHQPDQPTQTVNGQDQLQFTGLRPSTTYQVVVSAYIKTQSTASAPATFTTAPRGPDAPVSVHTSVNAQGDWVVSWTPCTSAKCVVPADVWNIVGAACGGSYVPQPPTVQVAGNTYTATVNADSLGLLGDSMTFTVNGQLASGLAGNPTAAGTCTQSWRPPVPADILLHDAGTLSGDNVTATLQVATASSVTSVEALGSGTTEYVYHVGAVTLAPTTSPDATVPGLTAGQSYTPSVTIYPAGHLQAAVTITGTPFTEDLQYPVSLAPDAPFVVDPSNPNVGTATIAIGGWSQLAPFQQYSAPGSYTCGSTTAALPAEVNGVITISDVNLDAFGGTCQVSLNVSDATADNPYGNVQSGPLTASFDATNPNPPSYGLQASFGQTCVLGILGCVQQVTVIATPTNEPFTAGDTWMIATNNDPPPPSGYTGDPHAYSGTCDTGPTPIDPTSFDGSGDTFSLPSNCSDKQAAVARVTVTYHYLGVTQTALDTTPSGTPATTTTTTTTTIPTTTTTIKGAIGKADMAADLAAYRTVGSVGDASSRQLFAVTLGLVAVAFCAGIVRRTRSRRRYRHHRKEHS